MRRFRHDPDQGALKSTRRGTTFPGHLLDRRESLFLFGHCVVRIANDEGDDGPICDLDALFRVENPLNTFLGTKLLLNFLLNSFLDLR